MTKSLRQRTIVGTLWSAFQKFGTLFLSFVANMVLARILTPDDFGCIAMLAIFMVIADTFVDSGLGSAIIQKLNASQKDYSTVFYFNIALAILLYIILFICAPFVAEFYSIPILSNVLRVEGLVLIINSFSVVQTAILRKKMLFKDLTLSILISTLVGVVVAIVMAYYLFGVWALVFQLIVASLVRALSLWIISHWKPSFVFSIDSFKVLFRFGSFIFLSNLINNIGNNVQGLVIGRAFNANILGYYTQARRLEEIVSTSFSGVVDQVTYPALVEKQNEPDCMIYVIRKLIKIISFVSFPLMIYLFLEADYLIPLCYGDQWVDSIPYFKILCIAGMAICLQGINYNAVVALGKSHSVFIWTLIKRILSIVFILIGLIWGIYGLLWGCALGAWSVLVCNAWQVNQFLGYSLWNQIKDIAPTLVMATMAGVISHFFIMKINCYLFLHIIVALLIYLVIYCIFSKLFRLEALNDVKIMLIDLFHKNG